MPLTRRDFEILPISFWNLNCNNCEFDILSWYLWTLQLTTRDFEMLVLHFDFETYHLRGCDVVIIVSKRCNWTLAILRKCYFRVDIWNLQPSSLGFRKKHVWSVQLKCHGFEMMILSFLMLKLKSCDFEMLNSYVWTLQHTSCEFNLLIPSCCILNLDNCEFEMVNV